MAEEPLYPFNATPEQMEGKEKTKRGRRPATDRVIVDDSDLLSDADKQAIREEAAAKVSEDRRKGARQRFLETAIREERMRYNPEEEIVAILIDLPGHSKAIVINGQEYHHGASYHVPLSVHRSMAEIMYRAWQHEDVVGGVNRDQYMKPARNIALRPGMENFQHPNTTIMRV